MKNNRRINTIKEEIKQFSIPQNTQELANEIGIANTEGWQQLEQVNQAVGIVISNLDTQLNNVLRK